MEEYKMIDTKDVVSLMAALVSFYRKLAAYVLSSVRQYFIAAILVVASVIGARWYFWHNQVPVYESETTLFINNLSRRSYGEMLEKLNTLIHSQSYSSLARVLNIPVEEARTLIDIDGRNMVGSRLFEDSSPGNGPIYIRVTAGGNKVFEPLQAGLVAYLNSSPYRSVRNEREKETQYKKIEFLKEDIKIIDSVVGAYASYVRNATPTKDTAVDVSGITSLMGFKSDLEDKLNWAQSIKIKELEQSVEVFSPFAVPDNPSVKQGRFPWLIIPEAILLSLVFCFFLKLFVEAWKTSSHE